MPGEVLTAASVVICAHGGLATPTAVASSRVQVMGVPVATQGSSYAVAGCANSPPPAGAGPCVVATWISAAARVRVAGLPVLLQESQALCAPTGTPLTVVSAQPRVRAT